MWSSLPAALIATLLLSTPATAFPHSNRKHGKNSDRLPVEEAITIIVKPMPVGTQDGVIYPGVSTAKPTPTPPSTIAPGVFPPKFRTRSGSSVLYPTGDGTGCLFPTATSYPIFTDPPVVIIPSGTAGTPSSMSSAVPTTQVNSTSTSSILFPVFTGTPIISVPVETVSSPVSSTSSSESASYTTPPAETSTTIASTETSTIDLPTFTGPPIIPTTSSEEVAATTVASTTLSESTPTPAAVTWPLFTGTPIISIPPMETQSASSAAASGTGDGSDDVYS